MENQTERVVVLDFGGQYNQLIARRIRGSGRVQRAGAVQYAGGEAARMKPKGIVFSGGPDSVYAEDAPLAIRHVRARELPILGICYGMQLMAHTGGRVERAGKREYGKAELE